jgi:hypothetical protein
LTLYHSFFLSLLPKFYRVVPQLQSCSIYTYVFDYVCFCVYICLLDLSSTYERKHGLFLSKPAFST